MSAIRYFWPRNQKVSPSTTQLIPPPPWQKPKRAERLSVTAAPLATEARGAWRASHSGPNQPSSSARQIM